MHGTELFCECGCHFLAEMAVIGGAFRCPNCSEVVIVPGDPVNHVSDEELESIRRSIESSDRIREAVSSLVDCLGRLIVAGLVAMAGVATSLVIGWVSTWTRAGIFSGAALLVVVFCVWVAIALCRVAFEIIIGDRRT